MEDSESSDSEEETGLKKVLLPEEVVEGEN
jgi:hypothetical protein